VKPESSPEWRGGSAAKGILFGCGGILIGAVLVIALLGAMIWWGCKSVTISQQDRDTVAAIEKTATSLVLPDVEVSAQAGVGYTTLFIEGLETPSEQSLFLNHLANEQARQEWTPVWVVVRAKREDGARAGVEALYVLTDGVVEDR